MDAGGDAEYEAGNEAFRRHDYHGAHLHYTQALASPATSSSLVQKVLLNRAQCSLNLRDYNAAIKDCTRVLETCDPVNAKALLRRAIAYEHCGSYARGLADVNAAMQLGGGALPPSLTDTATKLAMRLRQLATADAAALKAEGRPDRMVHSHQTLRLNFNADVPREVGCGQPFAVHLCIGNEFGLFDRGNMAAASGPPPEVAAVAVVARSFPADAAAATDPGTVTVAAADGTSSGSGSGIGLVAVDGKAVLRLVLTSPSSTQPYVAVIKFSLTTCLPSGVAVVPILSLPIRVVPSKTTHGDGSSSSSSSSRGPHAHGDVTAVGDDVRASCIRECDVGHGRAVHVFESPGSLGIGGKVLHHTPVPSPGPSTFY
jgi:hypothetical protein